MHDLAGNSGRIQNVSALHIDLASVSPLATGEYVSGQLDSKTTAVYYFDINAPDEFLWHGNLPTDAKFERLSSGGAFVGEPDADESWPVRLQQPGRYFLRVLASATGSPFEFKANLGSAIPYEDGVISSSQLKHWEFGVHRLQISQGDLIHFDRRDYPELDIFVADSTGSLSAQLTNLNVVPFARPPQELYVRVADSAQAPEYSIPYQVIEHVEKVVPLGTWIDATEMGPSQSTQLKYAVDDDQLVLSELQYSTTYDHLNTELRLPSGLKAGSILSRVTAPGFATLSAFKRGTDSNTRVRLRNASNPDELPLNTLMPPPAVAESHLFRFEHLGGRRTLEIESQGLRLALYTNAGRSLKNVENSNGILDQTKLVIADPGEYFLVLTDPSNDSQEPTQWNAEWVENDPYERTFTMPLGMTGAREFIEREFVDGLETYEFTIDAAVNDVFQVRLARDSAQVFAQVLDDSGNVAASGWTLGDARTWHAPRPGQYVLSIRSASRRPGGLKFEFLKLHNAPPQPANSEIAHTLHSGEAMVVAANIAPANASTQRFHANAVQSEASDQPTSATWYLIDHLGQRVTGSKTVDKPITALVAPGRPVWLVIEQEYVESGNEISVAWSEGDPVPALIDDPLAGIHDGQLNDLGEVHEYLLSISAGQTLAFADSSSLEGVKVFFDGTEVTDPSEARLAAFRTRDHLLRVQSARAGNVPYQFGLNEAEFHPNYLVDGEFSGIDVDVSGKAPGEAIEHRFVAPAGAWIYVDEIANRLSRWTIYGTAGTELFSGSHDSVGLMQIPATGEYRIVLQPSWDGVYGFAIRSPNVAQELPIGELVDVDVSHTGMRFLRARISEATELYLDSLDSGPAIIWDGTYRSVFFSGTLQTRRGEGDVVVAVKGVEGRTTVPIALVNSVTRASILEIGTESNVPVVNGLTQLFPIRISKDGSYLHLDSPNASVEVPPIEDTTSPFYRPSIAGDYTAYVTPQTGVDGSATIRLHETQLHNSPIRRPLELNTLVTGAGQDNHSLYHYEVELTKGDALWLTYEANPNWIAPNGLEYDGYARVLPAYEDGTYAVEIASQTNLPFSFRLTQFSELPTLEPGIHELSSADPVHPGAFRVAGHPGDVYGFQEPATQTIRKMHFVRRTGDVLEIDGGTHFREVTMPSDGEFFVFIEDLPSEVLQLDFTLRQGRLVDGEYGRVYTRTPTAFYRDEYSFDVAAGDYLWVDENAPYLSFVGPDDIPGSGFNPQVPAPRGRYTVQINHQGNEETYELRVTSRMQASPLPLGGPATLRQGQRYRLEIEEAGNYAVKLPDDEMFFAIHRSEHDRVSQHSGIYGLEPGTYWATWHGPLTSSATAQVTATKLPQIRWTLDSNELHILDPGETGAVEYNIELNNPPVSPLFVDYHLDDHTEAWIRFGNEDWVRLDSLGNDLLLNHRSVFDLRVVGRGLGTVRFVSVLGAPTIESSGRVSLSGGFSRELAIWTLDLGAQTNVTFRPTSRATIESWAVILDGRVWASATGRDSLSLSLTNPGKAILIVRTPGLTESEMMQFDVLSRQQ